MLNGTLAIGDADTEMPSPMSETLLALLYSFAWDGRWPTLAQAGACTLFTPGIVASVRAHR